MRVDANAEGCNGKSKEMFTKCSCVPFHPCYGSALHGEAMVQRVSTVAFEGIEARAVDVQVQVSPGLPAFTIL